MIRRFGGRDRGMRTMTGWIDADPVAAIIAVTALCGFAALVLMRHRRRRPRA
ncbi:MAG TPA: hypothetical protein VKN99_16330 [Polyangia bacterium]|nr:hypothetical protein [Polyangia bacterium]